MLARCKHALLRDDNAAGGGALTHANRGGGKVAQDHPEKGLIPGAVIALR